MEKGDSFQTRSALSTPTSDPAQLHRTSMSSSGDGASIEQDDSSNFERSLSASQEEWTARAESETTSADEHFSTRAPSSASTVSQSKRKTLRVLRVRGKNDENALEAHTSTSTTGSVSANVSVITNVTDMSPMSAASADISQQITVESKITSAQLERLKSKRKGKESSRGSGHGKKKRVNSMPVESEVDRRFVAVLETMDLAEEQLLQLQTCSVEKKWNMICDSNPREDDVTRTPRYLTEKLSNILKDRNYKDAGQPIKTMEILLRSSQVHWMNVFLSPGVDGLGVVLNLLETIQRAVRNERMKNPHCSYHVKVDERRSASDKAAKDEKAKASIKKKWQRSSSSLVAALPDKGPRVSIRRANTFFGRNRHSMTTDDVSSLNLPFDFTSLAHDVMLLIRAIMNVEVGFTAVVNDRHALNLIAACIFDTLPKTRMLVLEILTASCMMEGAHSRIVEAMDYNRRLFNEDCRFQTLVNYFKDSSDNSTQDYLCALLNFFNLVVHSSPNLNFRVHLQYDLTSLGFDELIRMYRDDSNLDPLFEKQMNAYVDNFLDVQSLLENFDNPRQSAANDNLTQENQRLREELANNETRYVAKIAELEGNLRDMRRSIEMLTESEQQLSATISRQASADNLHSSYPGPNSVLQAPSDMADSTPNTDAAGLLSPSPNASTASTLSKDSEKTSSETPPGVESFLTATGEKLRDMAESNGAAAPELSVAAPAPPPPPMTMGGGAGMPPPPPGMFKQKANRVIKTKYKLPALNWQVIHKKSWKSTIFASVNPDLYKALDMAGFEDMFKLKTQPNEDKDGSCVKKFTAPQVRTAKVLDSNFCRSIGILRKKLPMSSKDLIEQVNCYQVKDCDVDILEQLAKFCPSSAEIQKFERYEKNNTITTLSDEEMFVWELHRVPRFTAKLRSVVYMMKFDSIVEFVQPQVQAVYVAGSAVLGSQALRNMYDLVMAIGNYANSGRRGWADGFQLTSLDTIKTMKSTDSSRSLMNYIADFIEGKEEYKNIFFELVGLDRAAQVVLSQMSGELSQLVNGLTLLRAEEKKAHEKGNAQQSELSKFLENAKQVVRDMEKTCKRAQEVFQESAEYLGEVFKNQTPGEVFGPLSRFLRELNAAGKANEAARKKHLEDAKKKEMKNAVNARKDLSSTTHRRTADQLNDLLKKGNSLAVPAGTRQVSGSGFMDDMINASKVVAYRAGVGNR